jgi:phage shock protein PspC (stress-responsive transcriptional regulator)
MIDIRNKKLHRYPSEAILLGIAAGIGHFFEIDPVFVRLVWLMLAFLTNIWPMVVVYALLFFLMPIEPSQDTVATNQQPKDVTPPKEDMEPAPVEKMDSDQNM